jgi:hypothetical protein
VAGVQRVKAAMQASREIKVCRRTCSAMPEKDVHAGYGEQWIKTLKAAIEMIPNPLSVSR